MKLQTNRIHTPVLLNELITNLNIKPNGLYVDCTAGFGGHSSEIAKQLTSGHLTCIDQDINAINHLNKLFKNKKQVSIVKDNFVNLDHIVSQQVDGIVFDLGVSSLMFDDPQRGFSYSHEGPLDMRMNQEDSTTAAYIVNSYSRAQLINLFKQYADVNNPSKVVDAIIKYRQLQEIKTTTELAGIITDCFPGSFVRKHPAKVYFQALRIEVNKELEVLKEVLKQACNKLKPKGRLAIITFHSLEDRIVKNFFKEKSESKDLYGKDVPVSKMSKPEFKLITRKPVVPTEEEIKINHRSKSAKLRVLERI
ncbi:MAG: 16S rRNA (cytosine(1402)-N(4))-methyltransferase RsmH [Mycoplasmoidaceae bacterium]|nr:16S rRNA (cytosine(1402)-N(4))-methyltransferase RsmH [Mycoplasmoidaceae bacterium]